MAPVWSVFVSDTGFTHYFRFELDLDYIFENS